MDIGKLVGSQQMEFVAFMYEFYKSLEDSGTSDDEWGIEESGYNVYGFKYYILFENDLIFAGNYSGYAWYYHDCEQEEDIEFDNVKEGLAYIEKLKEKNEVHTPPPLGKFDFIGPSGEINRCKTKEEKEEAVSHISCMMDC